MQWVALCMAGWSAIGPSFTFLTCQGFSYLVRTQFKARGYVILDDGPEPHGNHLNFRMLICTFVFRCQEFVVCLAQSKYMLKDHVSELWLSDTDTVYRRLFRDEALVRYIELHIGALSVKEDKAI